MREVYRLHHRKRDGRELILYGFSPVAEAPLPELEEAFHPTPHLRYHPLRGEWVVYAAHRQERTFLPPKEHCPLCPSRPGGFPTEIPFPRFQVAVFENRFPALVQNPPPAPEGLPIPTGQAGGRSEVVVYTPGHEGSLATLSEEERLLLAWVWRERYQALYAQEGVRFVMPFENRGEAVGVTLHHPHGQIYAYPFVPPVVQREAQAFREGPVLLELLPALEAYAVDQEEGFLAFVPPFARYPYEVWVVPRARHPGPWTFSEAEMAAFARLLGRVVARYDALFAEPFPYVMVFHAAPLGEERTFHFHVEFYPPRRTRDRLKFLAGTELGAGTFVVDALPEDTARKLKEAL
ncbi:Galactose-1-phosphate uridylyltransferase [Thermus sp. CCB_US3_UF1]|uniref:galactose-1-phosphate uridylyltransferase n=1 Tax=unclassified Thermus TaxID=2619321 RepID=UPI0002389597|nr:MULTISPECIES: galactose-1-phosphate uridylyltransferase [unclassified Thermus]AEV15766.1 Galactose-1-phosphate uridylyltransferase [Thermus sp. CCB_US3_UF1]MCS6869690.1 galactose-1-phosphate uridylyltransferase [Thermus sp.]MCX7849743.1 galactose-1-phosphate uridylyltransferase [Thermus sp.]MDW8016365.1 galactose-1-phosphate uridylyltransferase [Thermus sp.]MDW8358075.1 galactose-1-phosphate uridylyltransferase [Thermus sp.]